MKSTCFILFSLLVPLLFAHCAGGFLYHNAEPLEFSDLDYGFPTKTALKNPRVAYIDVGDGEQTLLLVHGLASNAGFWRYNIPQLAQHFRVIAVDLPGYGKSEKGNYSYSMTFFAETLNDLIRELKLNNVVYIGHSMGGQIGMTLALHHPGSMEKLILVSSAGIEQFRRGEGNWLRNSVTVRSVMQTNEEGIRRNLALNFYNWNPRWEWMVEERARMAKAQEFEQFAFAVSQSVRGMLDEPTSHRLHEISHPTLIIYGKYDGLIPNPYLNPGFPSTVFRTAHEQIPDSQLVEIPGAGHMVQIERPEAINTVILQFLGIDS